MPTIYSDFFGIVGIYKKLLSYVIGLFRPIYRGFIFRLKGSYTQECCSVAQNFMLSMNEIDMTPVQWREVILSE